MCVSELVESVVGLLNTAGHRQRRESSKAMCFSQDGALIGSTWYFRVQAYRTSWMGITHQTCAVRGLSMRGLVDAD